MSSDNNNTSKGIKTWEKPEIQELGDAKELIKAEFSALFDQKNSATAADQFNANVS